MSNSPTTQSVLIGVAIALVIGAAAWVITSSPGAVSRHGVSLGASSGEAIYVEVHSGDSASSIAGRLHDAGVIDSAAAFERLAKITGGDRALAAGEYEFTPGTSVLDALTRIQSGLTSARIVTIPEGLRIEEIGALLEKREVVKASDFLAAVNALATNGTGVDPDLLTDKPRAATLEGYLFPATYSFKRNIEASEVALQMVSTLSKNLPADLRKEARDQGLDMHEVLSLAAIVEREAVLPSERPIIAGVFRNRLKLDMPLQADPTVQYAVAQRPGSVVEFGYWKSPLTSQDLQYNSTYNTYLKIGLPPGPIANPGLDSIIAVIRPAQTKYLYFVARNDGSHAFAETLEQHDANVAKYQR